MTLFSCCEQEEKNSASRQDTLELIPVSVSFVDNEPWGTRADYLPDGYVPYNELYPTTTPDKTSIGVFMTPESTTALGNFIYKGNDPVTGLPSNDWRSTVIVTEGTTYYIYGFMPREDAESASITPIDGNYANGAVISINNYNTLTTADVSVIVGARLGTAEEKITGLKAPLDLGKFEYVGQPDGENRAFVLLKHIYAGVHIRAQIDKDYHKLRSIKIKKMEMIAQDIHTKGNLTVTIRANDTNTDPLTDVTFTPKVETGDAVVAFYDDPEGFNVPETVPESFLTCFAPSQLKSFTLRTTYDVYDSKGNCVSTNRVAENKITETMLSGLASLKAGEITRVDLTIKPTYLYQLSEPDLNNPTITIE